jgi:YD repeat-containing protein
MTMKSRHGLDNIDEDNTTHTWTEARDGPEGMEMLQVRKLAQVICALMPIGFAVPLLAQTANTKTTYTYDALNRITQANMPKELVARLNSVSGRVARLAQLHVAQGNMLKDRIRALRIQIKLLTASEAQ